MLTEYQIGLFAHIILKNGKRDNSRLASEGAWCKHVVTSPRKGNNKQQMLRRYPSIRFFIVRRVLLLITKPISLGHRKVSVTESVAPWVMSEVTRRFYIGDCMQGKVLMDFETHFATADTATWCDTEMHLHETDRGLSNADLDQSTYKSTILRLVRSYCEIRYFKSWYFTLLYS